MLLTELPPIRNEYADVTIISESNFKNLDAGDKENYLVTARGGYKLLWQKYKTASTYGKVIIFIQNIQKLCKDY